MRGYYRKPPDSNNFVSQEDVEYAKSIGVMEYVERYDMDMFKSVGTSYQHKEHSSFWLYPDRRTGEWHYNWHSRGLAGTRALGYLTYCQDVDYISAVRQLCDKGGNVRTNYTPHQAPKVYQQEPFVLPEKAKHCKRVYAYLSSRGISRNILNYCLHEHILYEETKYHNCVFVGKDNNNNAVCASLKGTLTTLPGKSAFGGIVPNSNKSFTFRIENNSQRIHCFEAAIDALSWLTLQEMKGVSWQKQTVISAEGVSGIKPTADGKIPPEDKIPGVLPTYLKGVVERSSNKSTTFILHYDNDFCGKVATIKTAKALNELGFKCSSEPSPIGKDWNDCLKSVKHLDEKNNQNSTKEHSISHHNERERGVRMTISDADYQMLQEVITNLYDSTKHKDYTSKEQEGARKFSLALKSKLKDLHERDSSRTESR